MGPVQASVLKRASVGTAPQHVRLNVCYQLLGKNKIILFSSAIIGGGGLL